MTFFRDENFLLYVPLLVWVVVIFYLSSGRGSISNTAPVFLPLLDYLFPRVGAEKLKTYHAVLRKICHLAGYAMLAFTASVAFYNSSVHPAAKLWHVLAFAVVLAVAAVDEIRQGFHPHRVGSLADVALDCAGGLTMIFLFWIFAAKGF